MINCKKYRIKSLYDNIMEWMDNMLGQKYVKELVFKLVSNKLEEHIIQSKLNIEYAQELDARF